MSNICIDCLKEGDHTYTLIDNNLRLVCDCYRNILTKHNCDLKNAPIINVCEKHLKLNQTFYSTNINTVYCNCNPNRSKELQDSYPEKKIKVCVDTSCGYSVFKNYVLCSCFHCPIFKDNNYVYYNINENIKVEPLKKIMQFNNVDVNDLKLVNNELVILN